MASVEKPRLKANVLQADTPAAVAAYVDSEVAHRAVYRSEGTAAQRSDLNRCICIARLPNIPGRKAGTPLSPFPFPDTGATDAPPLLFICTCVAPLHRTAARILGQVTNTSRLPGKRYHARGHPSATPPTQAIRRTRCRVQQRPGAELFSAKDWSRCAVPATVTCTPGRVPCILSHSCPHTSVSQTNVGFPRSSFMIALQPGHALAKYQLDSYVAGTRRRRRHYFSLPCSYFRAQY